MQAEEILHLKRRLIITSNKLQRYEELEILDQTKNECQTFKIDFVTDRRKIKSNVLRRELSENFADEDVLEFTSCYFDSKIISYLSSPFNLPVGSDVNQTLRNPSTIATGAFGAIYLTDFETEKKLFIIKKGSRQTAGSDQEIPVDLLHDYFVGLKVTNKLREYIPNFAYTFTAFRCSNLNMGGFGTCNKDSKFNYIVMENIVGETLKNFIMNTMKDVNELMLLYIQIFLALSIGHRLYDYTHYDLHAGNVVLRKLKSPSWIKFQNQYIKSNYIATIIDYGYSHVKVGNKHFGYQLDKYYIYRNKSFPLWDIFKLLIFSYLQILARIGGPSIPGFDKFKIMFVYYLELATGAKFKPDINLDEIIILTIKLRYGVPKKFKPEAFNVKYTNIVQYIKTNFKEVNKSISLRRPTSGTIIESKQSGLENVANRISPI